MLRFMGSQRVGHAERLNGKHSLTNVTYPLKLACVCVCVCVCVFKKIQRIDWLRERGWGDEGTG